MLNKKSLLQGVLIGLSVIVLNACATGGLNEKPAELSDPIPSDINLDVAWWHILGDEFSKKSFGQIRPSVYQDTAYVALASGEVFVVTADGVVKALGKHDSLITAPLSINQDQFILLDDKGQVNLFDLDMNLQWTLKLNALSSEAALLTSDRVFVQTVDGRISAVERITGRLLWNYVDAEPNLTLTGTSTPSLIETNAGPAIVTGLANGKLVALSVVDGSTIWEYRITRASGKTDVSRLVDVDAQVTVIDDRLIATAYQGDLVVVETKTGQVLQAKKFSSYRSIKTDSTAWYGVNAKSHIVAMNPTSLEELWVNKDFEYRQLSEIVVFDDLLIVSDFKGFMHVIDKVTGEWLGSRHIDWRGAKTDPVKFANGVLMQGYSTRLKLVEFTR